jgi:hypothetical protein
MTCNNWGRVANRRRFATTAFARAHNARRCAPAQVGQLRRQFDRHRLGAPDPPAMGRKQPCIHLLMMGKRAVNPLQRYRPPQQIEVFILPAAGPTSSSTSLALKRP